MVAHSDTRSYNLAAYPFQQSETNLLVRGLLAVARFVRDVFRASNAAAMYQRYASMSDAELAAHGLSRTDIAQHVFDATFKD